MVNLLSKVNEVGVDGFRTILEVQPRYRRTYEALRREYAAYRSISLLSVKNSAQEKEYDSLRRSIGNRTTSLLEDYLRALGLPLECRQDDKTDRIQLSQLDLIVIKESPLPIFPARHIQVLDGYKQVLHLYPQKKWTFHTEAIFREDGRHELQYVSDALRLLFPQKYNGIGIPAVNYNSDERVIRVVPLSRVPPVVEQMQALGKALYPHLEDLDSIQKLMKQAAPDTPLMRTLRQKYLSSLVQAMGREME